MKRILLLLVVVLMQLVSATDTMAQKQAPELEYVFTLRVSLGQSFGVGEMSHGNRFVIPITGGTFEGENIKGTILPGGADYQLQDNKRNRTELEAIYCIRTDDGVSIHVRNKGIIWNGKDADGHDQFYFRTAPQFEAPADSKYDWMNNSLFLCTVGGWMDGGIVLDIWRVK